MKLSLSYLKSYISDSNAYNSFILEHIIMFHGFLPLHMGRPLPGISSILLSLFVGATPGYLFVILNLPEFK